MLGTKAQSRTKTQKASNATIRLQGKENPTTLGHMDSVSTLDSVSLFRVWHLDKLKDQNHCHRKKGKKGRKLTNRAHKRWIRNLEKNTSID